MSLRKLLKFKAEFDAFNLKMPKRDFGMQQIKLKIQEIYLKVQQQEFDLFSLWFEMGREAKRPFFSRKLDQNQEGNEVNKVKEKEFEEKKEEDVIDNPFDIIYENRNLNYIQIFQLNLWFIISIALELSSYLVYLLIYV